MALDCNTTKFLLYAKRSGADFSSTAMIGRQSFCLDAPALKTLVKDFGYSLPEAEIVGLLSRNQGYTEPLFELLGAREIRSFDASAYEGASDVHDFNLPIPDQLHNRFTAVVDSGSLEHVFNIAVAIKNCMQMVRVGGHFLAMSPANNWFAHGFYQFSPELFFRVFSPENGFQIVRILMCERGGEDWFEVAPEISRQPIHVINGRETYLLMLARKLESVPIFSVLPQQSNYVELWDAVRAPKFPAPAAPPVSARLRSGLRGMIPSALMEPVRLLRACRIKSRSPFDSKLFKKVTVP